MEILQEDVSVAGCDLDKYALGKSGQLHIKGPFHQSWLGLYTKKMSNYESMFPHVETNLKIVCFVSENMSKTT